MSDYLSAMVLFGISFFILAYCHDGEFGDNASTVLIVFAILIGGGLFFSFIGIDISSHSPLFSTLTILSGITLAGILIGLFVKNKREKEYAIVRKMELKKTQPEYYCFLYGHEEDGTCICPVCKKVTFSDRHRKEYGACKCVFCGTPLHTWVSENDVRYEERAAGDKLIANYHCSVCGETKDERIWFGK